MNVMGRKITTISETAVVAIIRHTLFLIMKSKTSNDSFGCVERFMLNTVDENTFRVLSCSSWIRFLVCRRAIHELHEVHGITRSVG